MFTMSRREAIVKIGGASVGALLFRTIEAVASPAQRVVKNGRVKQSVSWWPYQRHLKLPEFCKAIADMGLTAIDLLEEKDWDTARRNGLVCSMGYPSEGAKIMEVDIIRTIRENREHIALAWSIATCIGLESTLRPPRR